MTESLPEALTKAPVEDERDPSDRSGTETVERPSEVPEEFWDTDSSSLRIDALLKSYLELQRRLGAERQGDVPESPDLYRISTDHELLGPDPDVNARLHVAGFTQEQAQLLYDLAADRLAPMVAEIAALFEADKQIDRLVNEFGGQERWKEMSTQLASWGKSHLPPHVFDALSTTSDGIIAMHKMMTKNEPSLLRDIDTTASYPDEARLKEMMRDPRYWRDNNLSYIKEIQDGFKKIYPE